MNKIILSSFLILASTYSSFSRDTTAYNFQRNKINALLAERSSKFGQYDESLNERTGIFGFQTKRDIKHSNEILREIALNDNEIFKQLKILLDYKDLQVQEVKTTISSNTQSLLGYKTTIKNLQEQNQRLSKELAEKDYLNGFIYVTILFLTLVILYFAYLLNKKIQLLKKYGKHEFSSPNLYKTN